MYVSMYGPALRVPQSLPRKVDIHPLLELFQPILKNMQGQTLDRKRPIPRNDRGPDGFVEHRANMGLDMANKIVV